MTRLASLLIVSEPEKIGADLTCGRFQNEVNAFKETGLGMWRSSRDLDDGDNVLERKRKK